MEHLLLKFSRELGKEVCGLTQRATLVLARHHWPGKVRELANVIGHACMMTLSDVADVQDLPTYLIPHAESAAPGPAATLKAWGSTKELWCGMRSPVATETSPKPPACCI